MVVMAGVWSAGAATISGVTDAAGNTYTKATSSKASEDTELSVWSAPITAGGGTRPAITDHRDRQRRHRRRRARVRRSVDGASGAAAIDAFKTATGTSVGTGFVTSGPDGRRSRATTGWRWASTSTPASGARWPRIRRYTERVNVSPTSDMEFVVEDALPLRGDTPAARVSTGGGTPWPMATVVFKSGVQVAAGALGLAREPVVHGDRGRRQPGGQDADGHERGRRVDELDGVGERELVERVAGERHERRHGDGRRPSISGPGRRAPTRRM